MKQKLLLPLLFVACSFSFSIGEGQTLRFEKRSATTISTFQGHCDAYGFTISDNWVPYKMSDFQTPYYQFDNNGVAQYRTDIQQVLLRNTKADDTYAFAYRVTESPMCTTRNWGFLGIGSYGDDWYCSSVETTIDFPSNYELCNWAPENLPSDYSGSIGISVGSGGFQLSASINFAGQSVEIKSETNVAKKHFQAYYHSTTLNSASHSTMKFYGFCTFRTSSSNVSITVKHQANYYGREYHGVCGDLLSYTY